MIAGTANRADAEPLGGDRIDLAVAVPGDQHPEAVLSAQKRQQKMLAVPHCDDHRLLRLVQAIRFSRLHCEAACRPDETQILGSQMPTVFCTQGLFFNRLPNRIDTRFLDRIDVSALRRTPHRRRENC